MNLSLPRYLSAIAVFVCVYLLLLLPPVTTQLLLLPPLPPPLLLLYKLLPLHLKVAYESEPAQVPVIAGMCVSTATTTTTTTTNYYHRTLKLPMNLSLPRYLSVYAVCVSVYQLLLLPLYLKVAYESEPAVSVVFVCVYPPDTRSCGDCMRVSTTG